MSLENEDYYEVQVWADQVGCWDEVDSFATADEARAKVRELKRQNFDNVSVFSIVHFRRTILSN